MTAPSFSSFAPSFSSFPDLTAAVDHKHETVDKKRRKKHKHTKERNRETSPLRGQDGAPKETLQDRLFYSDRRGDFLNIQFGGLHVGDVPKYHVVDSMIESLLCGSS
jgi:hypothetical protein